MITNKFISNLTASNSKIRADRATRLAADVEIEVDAMIGQKKRDLSTLLNQIDNLTDLGPENVTSLLKVEKAGLNAASWVMQLHKAKVDLKIKQMELDVAIEIKTEWFTSAEAEQK